MPATRTGKIPAQPVRGPPRQASSSAPAPRLRLPTLPSQAGTQEVRHRLPPDSRGSYGAVLRVREFRWLSVAQALSCLGDQFAQVAIALLVYDRTGSPLLTATVYALTYLPPIVGGPLLSGLADLLPRRRVMASCDLIRMATVGLMAVSGVPFWALCALLFSTVLLGTPFFSARAALLPDILPARHLVTGSAVANTIHQATQIVGFVAGAGVVAAIGANRTLALDALSFGISALVTLAAIRPRPAATRRPAGARTAATRPGRHLRTIRESAGDGIRVVFGNRTLRTLVFFGWLAGPT
jgi:MFS family permease